MKTQFGASSFAILALLGLAACSGQIGDDTAGGGATPGGPEGVVVGMNPDGTPIVLKPGEELINGQICVTKASLASARISLLTDDQYVNVARDAFGVTFVPESTVATDGVYPLNESAKVGSGMVAQGYIRAADQVASKIKPCGANPVTAACLQPYLEKQLPLAWKRPVSATEITALMGIYNAGLPDGAQRALNLVMEAALGTGAFLYRTEVGTDATALTGSVALTPYELASAVSFSLMDSVPDPELWKAAVDGTITQPDVLSAQVDRLLLQPAAQANLTKKISYYLNMEKIPVAKKDLAIFPQFTATLQTALYDSAQKFLTDVVWGGQFSDLFTSNKYYANKELATVYNIPGVTGTTLVKVDLPAERNAGFLTQPGLLATSNQHTGSDDIVHRGLWVYDNLTCSVTIGAPPPNADAVFAMLTGTERVKAEKRDARADCGACHSRFDPFGMASENFDPIGRYRTIDPGDMLPVVSTGLVKDIGPDLDGSVSSMKDIGDRLAKGRRAADCATVHLAKYTLDHNPDVENSCQIQGIKDNFAKSGKFVDLFKAIVTSPAFLTRDLGVKQ